MNPCNPLSFERNDSHEQFRDRRLSQDQNRSQEDRDIKLFVPNGNERREPFRRSGNSDFIPGRRSSREYYEHRDNYDRRSHHQQDSNSPGSASPRSSSGRSSSSIPHHDERRNHSRSGHGSRRCSRREDDCGSKETLRGSAREGRVQNHVRRHDNGSWDWDESGPSHSYRVDSSERISRPSPNSTPGPSGTRRRAPSPTPSVPEEPKIRFNSNIFENNGTVNESRGFEEEVDAKPFQRIPGVDEPTDAQKKLKNIFEFTTAPLPEVAASLEPKYEEGPPSKIPRKTHFDVHTAEEEKSYTGAMKDESGDVYTITIGDGESDSGDELPNLNPHWVNHSSLRLKEDVFTKYDFQRRDHNTMGLAANRERGEIINAIENNRVVIIDGFTGCGKTTQVPQFLIDRAYETKTPCRVVVTQPRRLAAIAVARRVCEERGWEVGTVVGYHVGLDKKVGDYNLVTYMTTGVLLQKLTKWKSLSRFTHIIVDEVHERDLHTDLLLLFIKKILRDAKDQTKRVKLILMSATLNRDQFTRYFAMRNMKENRMDYPPVIKIRATASNHRVDELYLNSFVTDPTELDSLHTLLESERPGIDRIIYDHAVKIIINLDNLEREPDPRLRRSGMMPQKRGSVLVFLPGIYEIKTMQRRLNDETARYVRTNDLDYYKWDIIPLHSSITNEEQRKVFDKPKDYRRKIILSTNIAESSLTVPDIVYVIDFCLTKSNCVDERTNFGSLRTCWASVSQCTQRKGRTGRVRDGQVYRMVTKQFFSTFPQDVLPEMKKSSLEYVVLQIKTLDMGTPQEVLRLALDPPDLSGIKRAVANLKEVGALTVRKIEGSRKVFDTCDGELTFLGEIMALLPVGAQYARLIMLGYCFGVLKEAIIIAAGLNGKTPFFTPYHQKDELNTYLQKLNWSKKSFSDCFALLHAYRAWVHRFGDSAEYLGPNHKSDAEKRWAKSLCIQIAQMREIRSTVEEIEERLKQKGLASKFSVASYGTDQTDIPKETALMLKICIAGAFYPLYFYRQRPDGNYARERAKEANDHDLFSTVIYRNFPHGHRGELYTKYIADALSYGLSVPCVEVEGSKVFGIFDGSGKKIGPIAEGVYRAIKKRKLRQNVEFNALWREEEEAAYALQREELQRRRFTPCPPQVSLPCVTLASVQVHVTHVESPSQFWIIYKRHSSTHNDIAGYINNARDLPTINPRAVHPGCFVLAPYKDEMGQSLCYYRAKVLAKISLEKCLVYFVDYGNSDWVKMTDLRDFSPYLRERKCHEIPCLAIECRLSQTKPAVLHGSVWHEKSVEYFNVFVADMVELQMKIYAVDKSIISGELIKSVRVGTDREVIMKDENINLWLKKYNFADHCPEPHAAEQNHGERERVFLIRDDPTQINAINQRQIAKELRREFMEPPSNGKTPVTLKGPYSPIELTFSSLCSSSNAKSVTVDNNSVNCIVLDQEPLSSPSRMMIAATINIQDKKEQVVIRETTLMPAIPGILALMALIFAPRAEMRCDSSITRYTGVLCGLGMDDNREPVYEDHDLEVVFDTEIDDDDIHQINQIRQTMNSLLSSVGGASSTSLHSNLCKVVLELLLKKRKPITEETWPAESYVWGRLPESSVVPPSLSEFPIRPRDIFLPHATVRLTQEVLEDFSWPFAI